MGRYHFLAMLVHSPDAVPCKIPHLPHPNAVIVSSGIRLDRLLHLPIRKLPTRLCPCSRWKVQPLGKACDVHQVQIHNQRQEGTQQYLAHIGLVGSFETRQLSGRSDAGMGHVCHLWFHPLLAMVLLLVHDHSTGSSIAA